MEATGGGVELTGEAAGVVRLATYADFADEAGVGATGGFTTVGVVAVEEGELETNGVGFAGVGNGAGVGFAEPKRPDKLLYGEPDEPANSPAYGFTLVLVGVRELR